MMGATFSRLEELRGGTWLYVYDAGCQLVPADGAAVGGAYSGFGVLTKKCRRRPVGAGCVVQYWQICVFRGG